MYGPNAFMLLASRIDIYGGIALFTGLTMYDTHTAIERYKSFDPDHLSSSLDFYLNFINMLTRIMMVLRSFYDE